MEGQSDFIRNTIACLNELVCADPEAISSLFSTRIQCNDILANHPTLLTEEDKDGTYVTMLGLINGLLGKKAIIRFVKEGKTVLFSYALNTIPFNITEEDLK
jgi:hypothetical protein